MITSGAIKFENNALAFKVMKTNSQNISKGENGEEINLPPVPLKEENVVVEEQTQVKEEITEEYITYHVHVVSNNDSIEKIIKLYNTSNCYSVRYN